MKKVGKLRQWADEKLGNGVKTQATEGFRDLQVEVHLRQAGLEQIHAACQIWMRSLSKKKEGPDKEKNVPVELLGLAAHQHGEDYGHQSAFGALLKQFGKCQQQVARVQEEFVASTTDKVIENMERSLAQMKEYQAATKKLESRRLTYDSSLAKVQKAKREDSKLEEDLRAAKVRYEDISDDVAARMQAIRLGERDLIMDFAKLIRLERDYFHDCYGYVSTLDDWLAQRLEAAGVEELPLEGHRVPAATPSSTPRKAESTTEHSPPTRTHTQPIHADRDVYTPPASTTDTDEQDPFYQVYQEPTQHLANTSTNTRGQPPGLQMLGIVRASTEDLHGRPLPRRTATEPISRTSALQTSSNTHTDKSTTLVRANFAFDAENPNELSLRVHDVIQVLEEVSAGWWRGKRLDERTGQLCGPAGLFPANYCSPWPSTSTSVSVSAAATATSTRMQAPLPPSSACSHHTSTSMTEDEDTQRTMRAGAHTFPRGMTAGQSAHAWQGSQTVGIREGTGNRARPPPPPIPKKKTGGGVMPPTPQRQGSSR